MFGEEGLDGGVGPDGEDGLALSDIAAHVEPANEIAFYREGLFIDVWRCTVVGFCRVDCHFLTLICFVYLLIRLVGTPF